MNVTVPHHLDAELRRDFRQHGVIVASALLRPAPRKHQPSMTRVRDHRIPMQQAASDWFARLQGDAGLEDWTAFQAWLEADPDHAAAYEAVEAAVG